MRINLNDDFEEKADLNDDLRDSAILKEIAEERNSDCMRNDD